jgi:N-acetylmuramoyl-L-alanine amidase
VSDLHDRLTSLGLVPLENLGDTFTEATQATVEAFQRSRGLPITGVVDSTTWSRLLEAGWRLGDRLLFLVKPYLRGDDVAELQVRLSQLGFDPGRVDGVFGPLLERALSDFQRNCGLDINATLTLRTLIELRRFSPLGDRTLVSEARDEAGFNPPRRGPIVVWGESPLAEGIAQRLPHADYRTDRSAWSVEQVASYANSIRAVGVISLIEQPRWDGIHLHYWSSYTSYSRRGEQLASAIASAVSRDDVAYRIEVTGMALPILRETQMTTLHVEHAAVPPSEGEQLARAISQAIRDFFHS